MLQFVARRVLLMIPTLFVISALVYFIIDLPPGDCVTSQIEELLARGDPDAHARASVTWNGSPASSAGTSDSRARTRCRSPT
jgi:ABC-type microcin C transport system permease subunit YejB